MAKFLVKKAEIFLLGGLQRVTAVKEAMAQLQATLNGNMNKLEALNVLEGTKNYNSQDAQDPRRSVIKEDIEKTNTGGRPPFTWGVS